MRHLILNLLSLFLPLTVLAQKLTVESMTLATNDLSASQHRQMDRNGEPCGLVKVSLATADATFEGNVIPPVEYKTGEYWVYMSKGSRELRIKHPNFVPLHVTFANYGISKGIQSLATYNITLLTTLANGSTQTQQLIIDYTPTNAIVVVDSKPHQGNGHLELTLPIGSHDYQIVAMGYDAVEGSVKLNTSSPRTIIERLTASKQQTAVQPINTQKPFAQNNETKPDEDPEIAGLSNTQILGLAFNYANGVGGKSVDYAKALKYYQIAAERGNSDAMNNIGIMYEKGSGGLTKDISQAKYWYQKAADKGDKNAKTALKRIRISQAFNINGLQLQPIICFSPGKATIDATQHINIKKLAQYLKEKPSIKVLIVGNSLPEGDVAKNLALAKARADAVKDALISKYQINSNRITTKGISVRVSDNWNENGIVSIYDITSLPNN